MRRNWQLEKKALKKVDDDEALTLAVVRGRTLSPGRRAVRCRRLGAICAEHCRAAACPLMMLIMMVSHSHPVGYDEQLSLHGEAASSEPMRSDTSAGEERSLR
jgi:hypothetical protein